MTAVIEFRGQEYKLASTPGVWPLMQFARAARDGLTVLDLDSLAAIYSLLQSCLDPADWPRFEHDMTAGRVASVDELLDLATTLVAMLTAQAQADRMAAAAANGQAPG